MSVIASEFSAIGFDVPPLGVRRFTVEEYERLAEIGILCEDDSVELLEGLIVKKMTKYPLHDATIDILTRLFGRLLPDGWFLRIQNVLRTPDSEPEPDVVITRGLPQDYRRRHPTAQDVALVIEVAESSLERDWKKCRLYARAGVGQYWIVDLNANRLEIFTQPDSTAGKFARHESLSPPASASFPLSSGESVTLALPDFLPIDA
jgi:Uma2 family endonuclease